MKSGPGRPGGSRKGENEPTTREGTDTVWWRHSWNRQQDQTPEPGTEVTQKWCCPWVPTTSGRRSGFCIVEDTSRITALNATALAWGPGSPFVGTPIQLR